LNADWVKAAKRISPSILIQLLEETNKEVCEFLKSVDPFAPAVFSVAWAGEEQSLNWFDIAREYTERWHHQQQIRLAVNKPGILTYRLYFPVLDTFMRALPHAYRNTKVTEDTLVQLTIIGEANGSWFLKYTHSQWRLIAEKSGLPTTLVTIPSQIVWQLSTKGMNKQEASQYITIEGDQSLTDPILQMITVMA
jgi:hypothetical protein